MRKCVAMIEDVKVVMHRLYCTKHKTPHSGTYNMDYDSFYCSICNRWLEPECDCPNNTCDFKNRTEFPSV